MLNKEDLNMILYFLNNSTLRGNEAATYLKLVQKINEELKR